MKSLIELTHCGYKDYYVICHIVITENGFALLAYPNDQVQVSCSLMLGEE